MKSGLISWAIAACSSVAVQACTTDYTVSPGDTLTRIAEREMGSVFAIETIFQANAHIIGTNPNHIQVGQVLTLPCADVATRDIDWTVMPTPEALASLRAATDVQVLDIRAPKQHAAGVVPGAISIPYAEWRGPKSNRGRPPSEDRIAALIGSAGLRLDAPIVIVHDRAKPMQTGSAAVVYWILKSSGADQLAILRGGFRAWDAAGLPVSQDVSSATPYAAQVTFDWTWRADEVTVFGIATDQVPGALLDARPHGMFAKVDTLGRALATTLPGAKNLPAPPLMSALRGTVDVEDGVATVVEAFADIAPEDMAGEVVTFCSEGELGALNWFYASELARIPNIKLYPESVKGWTAAGGMLFAASQ
ncbi:MAG: rhodanese-like domain-containing protein [Pseudomonadota bacterium]